MPAICYRDFAKSAAAATAFGAFVATIGLAIAAWLSSGLAVVPVGLVVITACLVYVAMTVGLGPRMGLLVADRTR